MIDSPSADAAFVDVAVKPPKVFAASGRIGRVRYLAYSFAGMVVVMLAVIVLGGGLGAAGATQQVSGGLLQLVVGVLVLALTLILARRRLNDMGHAGWWGVLLLVPLVNFAVTLWLVCARGEVGPNRYGLPPAPNSRGAIVLACLGPALFIGVTLYSGRDAYRSYVDQPRSSNSQTF